MAADKRLWGAGAAVIAVILAGGAWVRYDQYGRYLQETNDAVIAADQVAIAAKLSGYVRAVAVGDNQQVAKGAPLIDIDAVDYTTRAAAAKADAGSAEAARDAADASAREAAAGVDVAVAAVQAAQVDFDHAAHEVDRYRPLAAAGAEPAEKLAALTNARDGAAANLAARRAALAQTRAKAASAAAAATQAATRIAAAHVAQDAAGNDLAATHITAPIAGHVGNKAVRVGQFVSPGMRLLTVVPDDGLYVLANFKETQVGLMRAGQDAEITVDALPGVTFHGTIDSITPGTGANFSLIPPQNATGNFTKVVQRVPVRIRIKAGPAARRVLVPGLSLTATVDTRAGKADIDAIRTEQASAR